MSAFENVMGFGLLFSMKDQLSAGLTRVVGGLQKTKAAAIATDKSVSMLKKSLAMGLVGAVGVGAMYKLASASGEFSKGMASVGVVTKASAKQMADLREQALGLGVITEWSPGQTVEGMRNLATAGLSVNEVMKTTPAVLNLATASMGQLGLGEAASVTTGILRGFGIQADRSIQIVDSLARATQLTNLQASDFTYTYQYAAAAGKQAGQSFNEVTTALGMLRNAGITASMAGTTMRQALVSITKTGAQKELQKLGIATEIGGKMRPVSDIIYDLTEKIKGYTDVQKSNTLQTILGVRGLSLYNAVANAQVRVMRNGKEVLLEGKEAYAYIRDEIAKATGTAEEFAKAMRNTLPGVKTLLRGTLETLAITWGAPVEASFTKLLAGINDVLVGFLEWSRAHPTMVSVISKVIALTSAVLLLGGAIKIVQASWGILAIASGKLGLGALIGKLGLIGPLLGSAGALLVAQIALAAIGIGGILYSLGYIGAHWEGFFGKGKKKYGMMDVWDEKQNKMVQIEYESTWKWGLDRASYYLEKIQGKLKSFATGTIKNIFNKLLGFEYLKKAKISEKIFSGLEWAFDISLDNIRQKYTNFLVWIAQSLSHVPGLTKPMKAWEESLRKPMREKKAVSELKKDAEMYKLYQEASPQIQKNIIQAYERRIIKEEEKTTTAEKTGGVTHQGDIHIHVDNVPTKEELDQALTTYKPEHRPEIKFGNPAFAPMS